MLLFKVLGNLRQSFAALAVYEILFKVVSFIVIAPLTAIILSWLISPTGSPALSNYDIISFLLSPRGLLSLLVLGALSFSIIFLEQAGILLIVSGSLFGNRNTFLQTLLRNGALFPRLFFLGLLQFAGYFLALVPFGLIAYVVYLLLLGSQDINYYLAEKPPEFLLAVTLGGILVFAYAVIALLLYVRWLFSLPLLLWQGKSVFGSLRQSVQLTRGLFWRSLSSMLLWFVIVLVLSIGSFLLFFEFGEYCLDRAGERLALVVPTVAALVTLNAIGSALWSAILFCGSCIIVILLYKDACDRAGIPSVAELPQPQDTAMSRQTRWSLRTIIWVTALGFLVLAGFSVYGILSSMNLPGEVEVTAHRGASREAPENSLSAIKAAIQIGADFAEIDVQRTADGVVVVIHDADLSRVAGVNKKISEITYPELKKLDAGSWFSPKFSDERIPTLEEVIAVAKGKIKLNIELKYNVEDEKLVPQVLDIIAKKKFEDQCVITSLKYDPLLEVKKLNPRLKTGLIVTQSIGSLVKLKVDFFSVNTGEATESLIDSAHAGGKMIHVWTVNDPKKMLSFIEKKADNIITDEPAKLIDLRQQWQSLSNVEKVLLAFRKNLQED